MSSDDVLLIIDMITPWDFEDSDRVAENAPAAVAAIDRIRRSGGALRVAYANDLAEGFHGSRERACAHALAGRRPDLVEPLEPSPAEDFIHKGQHSAFYGTPLPHLLKVHQAKGVILTGQITEQCILYTAIDAHVRGYGITVATDAVLSLAPDLGEAALRMIESNMAGRLVTSGQLVEGAGERGP